MFRNLEAEQKRFGFTDFKVAEKLGISRTSYGLKKKTGRFTLSEVRELCRLFNVSFEYLFANNIDKPA